jgi:hypothetical protein
MSSGEQLPDAGTHPEVVAQDATPKPAESLLDPLSLVRTEEAEVIRRRLAGQSFEEIAEQLFHPLQTAVYRFYAGLRRLRNHPNYQNLTLSGKLREWVAQEPSTAELLAEVRSIQTAVDEGRELPDLMAELDAIVRDS